ncbi:MAG: hypothetical protein AB7E51_07935 [Pseudodesulfovibrio sp.]|uniref:hypothetical protein n=1 Tax=Pseudodesulfovibrio sp. TaxID=2035812 RepID=UPI003D10435E
MDKKQTNLIFPLPIGLNTGIDELNYLKHLAEVGLKLLKLPPCMLGNFGETFADLDMTIEAIYLGYCELLTKEEQEIVEETIYRLSTGVSSYERFNRTLPEFLASDKLVAHEAAPVIVPNIIDTPTLDANAHLAEFNMVLDNIDSFEPTDEAGKGLKAFFLECRDQRDAKQQR